MQGNHRIIHRLEILIRRVEMLRLHEFLLYADNWKKRLMFDFLSGIVRGVGFSIGFTVLGALILLLLKNAALENLPIIGRFVAELVRIVESNLK